MRLFKSVLLPITAGKDFVSGKIITLSFMTFSTLQLIMMLGSKLIIYVMKYTVYVL